MVLFISKSNLISWFLVPDQTSFKSVEQFSRCSADLLPNMAENICLLSWENKSCYFQVFMCKNDFFFKAISFTAALFTGLLMSSSRCTLWAWQADCTVLQWRRPPSAHNRRSIWLAQEKFSVFQKKPKTLCLRKSDYCCLRDWMSAVLWAVKVCLNWNAEPFSGDCDLGDYRVTEDAS